MKKKPENETTAPLCHLNNRVIFPPPCGLVSLKWRKRSTPKHNSHPPLRPTPTSKSDPWLVQCHFSVNPPLEFQRGRRGSKLLDCIKCVIFPPDATLFCFCALERHKIWRASCNWDPLLSEHFNKREPPGGEVGTHINQSQPCGKQSSSRSQTCSHSPPSVLSFCCSTSALQVQLRTGK